MTRLNILTSYEIDAIYKPPKFSPEEKQTFFALSEDDLRYLETLKSNIPAQINYIMQMGYFRATRSFFHINFFRLREDVRFILEAHFPNCSYPKKNIGKHLIYKNQKQIIKLFCTKYPSKAFLQKMLGYGQEVSKRDLRPKSIFYELLDYCQKANVIRPSYSILQRITSTILKLENKRLHKKLKQLLDKDTKRSLGRLLKMDEIFYKLTLLKKDPKDFGTNEMRRELTKQGYIASIFEKGKVILAKLDISRQNIQYYAELAEYYDISKLKRMKKFTTYLYLLCFVWQRFNKINDHLVTYFIYKTNSYIKDADQFAKNEVYQAKLDHDANKVIAGKMLFLYSNKKIEDKMLRPKAFSIVPEKVFDQFVRTIIKPNFDNIFYQWKYYSKTRHAIKMNLRPVFKELLFDSEKKRGLLDAIEFLKKYIADPTKFRKVLMSALPLEFFPKKLRQYLIKQESRDED